MMTIESPYRRLQFNKLSLLVDHAQRAAVEAAIPDWKRLGSWIPITGCTAFSESDKSSPPAQISMWDFRVANEDDAMRAQNYLDSIE
ncbi:hypothetical protein ACDJ03_19665 [Xanthomonas axonopodis pv. nakataecorchori]|uniref:hypothetical protein n=1 Tax=Xanthomonas axonopodis TaxID=53413 RepID=UPI003530E2AB